MKPGKEPHAAREPRDGHFCSCNIQTMRATGINMLLALVTSQTNGMAPCSRHREKEQGIGLSLLRILSLCSNFDPF